MFGAELAKEKAIAYYRHSAEDKQENSILIQSEHAENLARENNIEIIHSDGDDGVSGLIENRPAFQRLFDEWILNPKAPAFKYVLVYDVSRWGRFQDQDQAAYLEFLCKKNGKKVIYVSRGMPTEDGQLISHLQTSIERYMAAEYSRQLSEKVFYGSAKVSEQGYSAGGTACFGMVRVLLDVNKNFVRILKHGERKSIDNERVTFAPANDTDSETVKKIFDLFVKEHQGPTEIADILNSLGLLSATGRTWDRSKVTKVLSNATYMGTRVYNKTWNRLKQGRRANPTSSWILAEEAFLGIVDRKTFELAQERMYWLMPSKWQRGIRATGKAEKLLYETLADILGPSLEENKSIGKITFSFAVDSFKESERQWCFLIEDNTVAENIVCVGITPNKPNPFDRLFILPRTAFSNSCLVVLTEGDKNYNKYLVHEEEARARIVELLQ